MPFDFSRIVKIDTPEETVVHMDQSNIQYQITVKDVPEIPDKRGDVPDVHSSVTEEPDEKIITFISDASKKAKILNPNKYQVLADELTQELSGHKQTLTEKMEMLETAQTTIVALKAELSERENNVNELVQQNEHLSNVIDDLKSRLTLLQSENGSDLNELYTQIDNLKTENLSHQTNVLKLHTERDQTDAQMTDLKERFQRTLELLSQKVKDNSVLEAELRNARNQNALYRDSHAKLSTELSSLREELAESKKSHTEAVQALHQEMLHKLQSAQLEVSEEQPEQEQSQQVRKARVTRPNVRRR